MRLLRNASTQALGLICAALFLSPALHAATRCSGEVKVLVSPATNQTVIASLRFEKETTGQVYFFDNDELDLLKQGVIVRVRAGENNDLTIKVRVPKGSKQVDTGQLGEHFACEINRTGAGEDTDYSVQRKYEVSQVPKKGSDIASLLSRPQEKLLREAGIFIDWSRVKRVAEIRATTWKTTAQSPSGKLALERWEWPGGTILEISTKVGPDESQAKYDQLLRLMDTNDLSLSATQGNKTSMVLETLTDRASPPR
jgi:hypothetical protein